MIYVLTKGTVLSTLKVCWRHYLLYQEVFAVHHPHKSWGMAEYYQYYIIFLCRLECSRYCTLRSYALKFNILIGIVAGHLLLFYQTFMDGNFVMCDKLISNKGIAKKEMVRGRYEHVSFFNNVCILLNKLSIWIWRQTNILPRLFRIPKLFSKKDKIHTEEQIVADSKTNRSKLTSHHISQSWLSPKIYLACKCKYKS